jgi:dihydrofolate reductase
VRRIVLAMSVSLDGYFAGPDGELDWHMISEELHWHFNEHLRTMSAFLDGRVTYEMMADFWPTADADPASTPPMVDFARIWRDMPKLVFSKTLQHADWNATIVRDVVPAEIAKLKAEPGGDMALGGAVLAADFLRHGLVDELCLYVHPLVIGEGRRLFPPDVHLVLQLVETRTFDNGVVLLRYAIGPR